MVDLLISLGSLVEEKYRHFAFKTIEYYSYKLAKSPIYFPYLFNQAFRYTQEDRIVKAAKEALEANPLSMITYPFTLTKLDPEAKGYMVCGTQSCFAATDNVSQLETVVRNSLPASETEA